MPTQGLLYPGVNPTVSGNKITVERFVKSPSQVFRVLSDLAKERFIADFIYASGDAQGGAVLYDELAENDLYASNDPQEIAPGDEFPLVQDTQGDPKVAAVAKRGSAFPLTYEAVRRDSRDVLNRGLIKLRNSSVRKHDVIAVAALQGGNTRQQAASATWAAATGDQFFADLFTGTSVVENADLGYAIDTIIVNPLRILDIIKKKDVRDALPRENVQLNPVVSGRLSGLCGIPNWIVTNRQPATKATMLTRQVAGSIRDEVPFYSRTINQEERERYLIMAGRVSVPIVTDPLAVLHLNGIG